MIAAGAYRPTAAVAQTRKGCGGMATARIRAAFDCPIETVWAVVTSLGDISWRSDITGIDIPEPGKTFVEQLTKIRMKKARTLLKNGNMTVENIAASVGYPNVEHFNRTFKKLFDMTPIQYRNS